MTARAARRKETKHEKFVRIATKRANNAADAIRLVGLCGNTANYEYTPEEKKKLFAYLRKALREAERGFDQKPEHEELVF